MSKNSLIARLYDLGVFLIMCSISGWQVIAAPSDGRRSSASDALQFREAGAQRVKRRCLPGAPGEIVRLSRVGPQVK